MTLEAETTPFETDWSAASTMGAMPWPAANAVVAVIEAAAAAIKKVFKEKSSRFRESTLCPLSDRVTPGNDHLDASKVFTTDHVKESAIFCISS
jgi:hypothetical protein